MSHAHEAFDVMTPDALAALNVSVRDESPIAAKRWHGINRERVRIIGVIQEALDGMVAPPGQSDRLVVCAVRCPQQTGMPYSEANA